MIEIKKLEMEETEEKDQETTKNVEIILQGPDAEEFSGVLFSLLEKEKPRDVVIDDEALLCGRCGMPVAPAGRIEQAARFLNYCPHCGQKVNIPTHDPQGLPQ